MDAVRDRVEDGRVAGVRPEGITCDLHDFVAAVARELVDAIGKVSGADDEDRLPAHCLVGEGCVQASVFPEMGMSPKCYTASPESAR